MFPSISSLLIDDAQERFAGDEAADVLAEESPLAIRSAIRLAAKVRRQNHVRQVPERMTIGQGFWVRDVESRPGDSAGLQRRDQIVPLHQATAGDVDEIG